MSWFRVQGKRFPVLLAGLATVLAGLLSVPTVTASAAPQSSHGHGHGQGNGNGHGNGNAPAPGTLLRAQRQTPDASVARLGGSEWKIWYSSRSALTNKPIVVTGVVIVPGGSAPSGGWPVVAWAHGTTGVADCSAPSSSSNLGGQLSVSIPLLAKGYLIAATDYDGLGTPGPHPYLDPTAEGRSVIDSVRAAGQLTHTSSKWAVFGASQGGQAAWATGELAPTWGRGTDFLGTVAAAPAADVSGLADELTKPLAPSLKGLYGFVLYGLKLRFPQLNYADYVHGGALAEMSKVGTDCSAPNVLAQQPAADFTPSSSKALDRLRGWLERIALPQRHIHQPMFVAQGTADTTVLPQWNDTAVARACRMHDTVWYQKYPGVGHPALPQAENDAVAWIGDRFAGTPAPDTCRSSTG